MKLQICTKCKSSNSRIESRQDDTKRCGLGEWLFTKCSYAVILFDCNEVRNVI